MERSLWELGEGAGLHDPSHASRTRLGCAQLPLRPQLLPSLCPSTQPPQDPSLEGFPGISFPKDPLPVPYMGLSTSPALASCSHLGVALIPKPVKLPSPPAQGLGAFAYCWIVFGLKGCP